MHVLKTGKIWLVLLMCLALSAVPGKVASASAGVPILTAVYLTNPAVPASANNGTTTTVTVTGTNLTGVTGMSFLLGATPDTLITISNIIPNATTPDTKFRVDVTAAAGAVVGFRNATVTTPSGTSNVLNNAFQIFRATVSLVSPGVVSTGSTFWVEVNVTDVANLNASQFDLTYEPTAIQVTGDENTVGVTDGVTDGRIPGTLASTNYPQAGWTFQPNPGTASGTIRVLGHMSGVSTVTGSGYLARINFLVTGAIGATSNITLTGLGMYNANTSLISPDSATNSSVSVVGLSITNTFLPEGTQGVPYAAGLVATGGTLPYAWGSSGLPVGLTLNPLSGAIGGTPSVNGNFSVSFNVTDSTTPVPSTVTKSLNIQIYPALQINTVSLPEATQGKAYPTTTVSASGGKGAITFGASGLPTGLSINAVSGSISGTPTTSGNFSVTLTVSDSFVPANSVSKPVGITVYAVLQITTSSLPPGVLGSAYSATVAGSGGKVPYSWSATSLPGGLTIGPANGAITGIPAVTGNFNVNIVLSDAFAPANTTNITLALSIGSGVTIITNSLPEGTQNLAYPSTQIVATGGTVPYSWSASGLPAGMSIGITSGIISGTPGASGNFSVSITVTDAVGPGSLARIDSINTVNLNLRIYPPLVMTTTQLPRWAVEVFLDPVPNWWVIPPPGWILGQAYTANLTATGGKGIYTWGATGLPTGLVLNTATGLISGTPSASGNYSVNVSVIDVLFPASPVVKTFVLKIYKPGDANGNDVVNIGDVTFEERVLLGLEAPTAGCDANVNKALTIGDVTKTERIILNLT